jgi:hypothetical protein
MTFFAEADEDDLLARPETFIESTYGGGAYARNAARTALALEVTAHLVERGAPIHFRGGTRLQAGLQWPPRRASLDNDYETMDAESVMGELRRFAKDFSASRIRLNRRPTKLPGFKMDLVFEATRPGTTIRIDALEVPDLPATAVPWRMPTPWRRRVVPSAASPVDQAAAKLLLTAEPPFGRTIALPRADRGRKSRIKDLYDLSCLAELTLAGPELHQAIQREVTRKSAYLGRAYQMPRILDEAIKGARFFAAPRPRDTPRGAPMWRAYGQVRQTIRDAFTEIDLRIASGCTHHALHQARQGAMDWADAWRPFRDRTAERRKSSAHRLTDGLDFGPADRAIAGLQEAWKVPP